MKTTVSLLPSPREVGMPDKFTAWRPRQDEAIFRVAESSKRFVVNCAPTGQGKSLTYMAAAHLTGLRTIILTSTKGLQSQLFTDFQTIGLKDVKGMSNYPCRHLIDEEKSAVLHGEGTPMCDIGPCLGGYKCKYRYGSCDYYNAASVGRHSKLVVTNYAYWLHGQSQRVTLREDGTPGDIGGLGAFDVLVLDEAHDAPEELSSFLSSQITKNQTDKMEIEWPQDREDWDHWREWAKEVVSAATTRILQLQPLIEANEATRKELKENREMSRIALELGRVAGSQGEWVHHMSRRGDRGYLTLQFDPVWPGEFAERDLFRGVEKIVLTSATVRPKTLDLLGVPHDQVDFVEYPSTFPVERRPVIWSPTVRVDNRAGSDVMRIWVAKIDAIIRGRLDRKGIIHTVSYARRDFLLRHSEFASRMVTHETKTTLSVVAEFKKMPPSSGAILVSPSLSTGYDFPYDECRYQIVGKVPFPDSRDKIVKARTARDKEYGLYITMQTLQQMAGRGMRAEDDFCETFLIDDHCSWFIGKWGNKLGARWFTQSFKRVSGVPEALKL